jgi:serine/threonine-protein kinase
MAQSGTHSAVPQQRYKVIERLEAGGMAEVFLGESDSLGFKKRVAIKRVLPHLAQNKKFMAMFLDEARLSLRLSHKNCVQVFDIGMSDNTYFIVMEFVEGANLKNVIENLRKRGQLMPIPQAIFILIETLQGLAYAHELADHEGKQLHIVHRDVSPPNILISKQGEVKVVDFGLAKAAVHVEKTDPGVVKGKFSYLSPEAATGEDVDARADIFAAGVILWEMLSGRRLFLGETDYQTVQLVRQAAVPPLTRLNPQVPADLDGILARALARSAAERYQSGREFADALANFLFSHGMKVTGFDVSGLVGGVMADQAKQKRLREPSIIDKLIQDELLRFTSLDEVSDPLSPETQKPAGGASEGADPLVDTSAWAAELGDGGDAPIEPRRPGWNEPGALEKGPGLAETLEGEATGQQELPVPSTPPEESSSGGGKGLRIFLVALLVVLIGGGVAFALTAEGQEILRGLFH